MAIVLYIISISLQVAGALMDFDGIRYKSAVSNEGYNFLFFDTNKGTRVYDIVSSKVYAVKSIDIDYETIMPFK